MKLSNNKILITGGATGIGLGLTESFYRENNTVIVCGRTEQTLKDAAERFPGVIYKVCDLSVKTERIILFNWIKQYHPDLNVLVNNAGIMAPKNISDPDFYEKYEEEVAINVDAPVHLTQLFLTLKSLQTIINVTSGLAFVPFSKIPVYCATKAFLRSFTLSLRHILKATDIEVIEIIPPALNSRGTNDKLPAVSDFVNSAINQLKEGRIELAFGSSETRLMANNESIAEYFKLLNP